MSPTPFGALFARLAEKRKARNAAPFTDEERASLAEVSVEGKALRRRRARNRLRLLRGDQL